MSLLNSLGRFFSSLLGLAQGKTERVTDKMLTANADTIRSQFRKTKEDWNRDYKEMREAIAELIRIREMKTEESNKLVREAEEIQQKMHGAIELYKQNPDERYKAAYAQLGEKLESNEQKVKTLEGEIVEQHKAIESYKGKLVELQRQIDALNKEEAETVADIISSQKIKSLNDRLLGLSTDSSSKNLEAVRSAREKSKTVAKLSSELSGADKNDLDSELKLAGSRSKHLGAFDAAVSVNKLTATKKEPPALSSGDSSKTHVRDAETTITL